ncbi:hypothetical protein SASPL_154760 [Salvia splendens]|uniref:Uncharacterized protein n=1 Tax=Salvia splendens TaxID=180675 RepID=A0A8X8Z023_SALSN|nr:hypothetical protein SASPL_154760 [Salvia splendens]
MAEGIGASPILSLINVRSNDVVLNDDVTLDFSRNVVIPHPRSVMQVFVPPDHHVASSQLPEDQPIPSSKFGDVIEAKVGATSTPSYGDYYMESHLQKQASLCVDDRDLFRFEQTFTSDGRSISPRNVVTCLDRSCATLRFYGFLSWRQRTPYVACETIWASQIPVNPLRHTSQNASSTRTRRPPPSRFEAAASLPSESRQCIQIETPQFYGDNPLVPEGFVVDVLVGPLDVIDSSRNRFQGQIDEVNLSSIFCWSTMLHLDVSGNFFGGRFSASLSRLVNLGHPNLAHNGLKEQELLKVNMLSGLEHLSLSTTTLIGEIPSNASHLSSLRIHDPSKNNLSSHIPGTIAKNLQALDLSCNKVVGEISFMFMQELHELERFSFCGSRFSAEILQNVSVGSVNSCLIAAASRFPGDPADVWIGVQQRCDSTCYTMFWDESSEYRVHKDDNEKKLVQWVEYLHWRCC